MPTTATLPGASPTTGVGAYGLVPSVPSPQATQAAALYGNLQNLPQLQNLAAKTNVFGQQQLQGAYQAALPQYLPMTQTASQNIMANLQGQIAPDVLRLMQQQAAARGVATGGVGAPNTNLAYLQILGRTSQDLQNLGQQQLTSAIGRTPIAQQFNPALYYVSPEQQFTAQAAANVAAGAPSPQQAALAAQRAAASGVAAGLGAGGRGPSAPSVGAGYDLANSILSRYGQFGSSGSGTGTIIGGVNYQGGSTPATAAANWQNWISGLPASAFTPQTTETGTTGPSAYTPEEDMYFYGGVTPEDLSSMGMTESDLYSGAF